MTGPSEISRVVNSDDHAMSKSEGTSHRSVLEFVPLNENIAGISSVSRRVGFAGIHPVSPRCAVTVIRLTKEMSIPATE